MKKLLFLMLAFATVCIIHAQQHVNTEIATETNRVFSRLDKHRIPYSILLDYGYEFVDVKHFDGRLKQGDYITPAIYRNIYNTLLSARVTTSVPAFEAPEIFDNKWAGRQKTEYKLKLKSGKRRKNPLILNGLYYKYSKINSNALAQRKIRIVNNGYDDSFINGRWQNPYQTGEAFAITLPVKSINEGALALKLERGTWYTNQASAVNSFAVNFGDGSGYKNMSLGNFTSHTYRRDGTYTITYRMRLKNGQYKYCRNKLKVTGTKINTKTNPACSEREVNITANRAHLGVRGSATLQIAYADVCGEIRKPLIIAEGLDTGLQGKGAFGDTNLRTFVDDIDDSESIDLQNLITNNTNDNYDIIYVNWDNGTDYLERNAYVLEAVIAWVNANKKGNEKNVILGQSMGGLLARYALRDMENRNENHDTKLYISHDAPHQGAHIPVGLQYMTRHVLSQVIKSPVGRIGIAIGSASGAPVNDARELLDRPAVKQMLINHVNKSYQINNTEHNAWQTKLREMGYPQQTRNIALSNGNHCASNQGFSSNDVLFSLSGSGNTRFLSDLLLYPLSPYVGWSLGDTRATLLGYLPGKSTVKVDFKAKTYANTASSAQVYKGKITYKKTLLWVVPITRTVTNKSFNATSSVFLDNMPGGVNPFNKFDGNDSGSGTNPLVRYGYDFKVNSRFNFISTVSALDVGGGNSRLYTSDYTKVYTATNRTTGSRAIPFDNFATSSNNTGINEPHISFNRRNGDWLAEELDADNRRDIFDCSFACSKGNYIRGPYSVCNSQRYSIDVPSGINVSWSVTPTSAGSFSNNGSTTTFNRNNNYSGNATITARVSGGNCGNGELRKNIRIESTSLQVFAEFIKAGHGGRVQLIADAAGGTGPYKWYINGGYKTTTSSPYAVLQYICGNNYESDIDVSVVASAGDCDTARGRYTLTGACDRNYREPMYLSVYPNPTSNELTLSKSENKVKNSFSNYSTRSNKPDSSSVYNGRVKVEIYNMYNGLVFSKKYKNANSKIKINTARFKDGIYILKVTGKDINETHQIIVEK